MLGNLGSSVMGMVRQIVVAALGSSIAGPFTSAISPAQTFNDLLINGSINGALIPTFNDYAAPEKREELRRIVFTIVNLVLIIMSVAAIIFLFIAPWFVATIQVPGYTAQEKVLTTQFARIIFFSLLGAWDRLQCYRLRSLRVKSLVGRQLRQLRIMSVLFWVPSLEVFSERATTGYLGLAIGVIIGAFGEIALLLPGMRNQHIRYMFVLDLKHPALRRILKLYAPVAFSFLVSTFFIFLDQRLASLTPGDGAANYAAMRFATTLIQFPGGLVATALSVAVLPTMAEHVRAGDSERFKGTLLLGLRLGLLLMIPAPLA